MRLPLRLPAAARNPVSLIGIAIATATAWIFLVLLALDLLGYLENSYIGLVLFVAIPAAFIVGLLLIPIGVRRERRRAPGVVPDWPVLDLRDPHQRSVTLTVLTLTFVNVLIVSIAAVPQPVVRSSRRGFFSAPAKSFAVMSPLTRVKTTQRPLHLRFSAQRARVRLLICWTPEITSMMRIALVFVLGTVFTGSAFAQDAVARGRQEFVDSKCLVCHQIASEGNKKGAALDGVGVKLTPDQIRQWITNAPEMAAKAGIDRKPPMKAYTDFSKDKVDALVAYLSSLKK